MANKESVVVVRSPFDVFLEALGWLMVAGGWVFVIWCYNKMPETIPIHFGASGKADGYGGRATIFTMPIVGAVLYASLTLVNKYPAMFNYPVAITPENAQRQYTLATRLIRILKTETIMVFNYITFCTYSTAIGGQGGLGYWFLPVFLVLMIGPIIWAIAKMKNAR